MLGRAAAREWAPNLMVNGADGHVLPRNLRDVIAVMVACLDGARVSEAIAAHPGVLVPDLPTGGLISGEFADIAATGMGKVRSVARVGIEGSEVVVDALPYGVDWDAPLSDVTDGFHRTLPGLGDMRDDSCGNELRLVFVPRGVSAEALAERLRALPSMSRTVSVDGLVRVDDSAEPAPLARLIEHAVARSIRVAGTAAKATEWLHALAERHGEPRRTTTTEWIDSL